jgi:hypothetical protein
MSSYGAKGTPTPNNRLQRTAAEPERSLVWRRAAMAELIDAVHELIQVLCAEDDTFAMKAKAYLVLNSTPDLPTLFSLILLPLRAHFKFLLLAPELERGFPGEPVPVNRQREIEGVLVIHELPHGGERENSVL